MSISSVVITKPGGLTTTESLVSNLPIIVINPLPGQEEENALFLEKNNVGVWIRKDDNPEVILSQIFNSPNKLAEMKEHTKLLAKPNSTKQICDTLVNIYNIDIKDTLHEISWSVSFSLLSFFCIDL